MHTKNFILFVFILSSQLNLFAQRIENKIITRHTNLGIQYFVLPQKGLRSGKSSLEFDQTTFVGQDSVRVGITMKSPIAMNADSLLILSGGEVLKSYAVKPLFLEFKNKKWESRIFFSATQEEVIRFFGFEVAPLVVVSDKDNRIELEIKKRKWLKMTELNTAIYQQINLNKR